MNMNVDGSHDKATPLLAGGEAAGTIREQPLAAAPATSPKPAPRKPSGFAGFSWGQIVLGALLCSFAIWGFWLTREVQQVSDRRIVTVAFSAMVNDFVAAEARSGNGPEQVQADTTRFMQILQTVLDERAQRGEIIIVGEAVVAGSAPDITAEVRSSVGQMMVAGAPAATALPAPQAAQ